MPEQSALEVVVKTEPKKEVKETEDEVEETTIEYIDPFDENYHVQSENLRGTIKNQKHNIEDTPFHP